MLTRFLRALLWTASLLTAVTFLFLAVRGLVRPLPADPIETGILEHAVRFANHEPLYTEPAASAWPWIMPGFPIVVSVLVNLFGSHLWEPRLLSLLASLVAAFLAAAIAREETGSWTVAVTSGGFLLGGYCVMIGQPVIARAETLMLALVLGGYFALRTTRGIPGALLSVGLITAACMIQLQAAWFAVAAIFYLAFEERRRFLAFVAGFAVVAGAGYIVLSQLFGPWFNFNALDAPIQALRFHPTALMRYVGIQLLGKLAVLTIAATLSFALPTPPWRGPGGMWMCMGMAAVGAGVWATQSAHIGSQFLLPSVVAFALLGPISMQRVTRHLSAWPGSSRMGGQGVVFAGLVLQLIVFLSSVPPTLLWPATGTSASTGAYSTTAPR
jgi:hypothetical protein